MSSQDLVGVDVVGDNSKLEEEEFGEFALKVFDVFDGDSDGYLNQHELGMALRKLDRNLSEADITALLNEVSHTNFGAYGRISQEHFSRILQHIDAKGIHPSIQEMVFAFAFWQWQCCTSFFIYFFFFAAH